MNAYAPFIRFEPVCREHYPLLRSWLDRPHVRRWWGNPSEELGYIRDMVEGRDTTRPFICCLAERPVGYVQVWFVGDHQNETWIASHPWLRKLPKSAVGVDITIGEPDLLSVGLGSTALNLFCERLRNEGHRTIVIDPDPDNGRAVRCYWEKAGFRPIPQLVGQTGDCLLMQFMPGLGPDPGPTRGRTRVSADHDHVFPARDRLRARPLHRWPE